VPPQRSCACAILSTVQEPAMPRIRRRSIVARARACVSACASACALLAACRSADSPTSAPADPLLGAYLSDTTEPSRAFEAIDLGTPAGVSSFAADLNRVGHVAGTYASAAGPRAFLWTEEQGLLTLPLPSQATGMTAVGLSDADAVVGGLRRAPAEGREEDGAYFWSDEAGLEQIVPLAPFQCEGGTDVNTDESVLVTCDRASQGDGGRAGWLWRRATGEWLRIAGLPENGATNELTEDERATIDGELIGGRGASGAAYWSAETGLVELTPDDFQGCEYASAINRALDVVLNSDLCGSAPLAFLASPSGGRTRIPPLPGDAEVWAIDVNDRGFVLAQSRAELGGTVRYLLWRRGGQPIDLTPVLGAGSFPTAINERGEIAGQRLADDGSFRATLWVPRRWSRPVRGAPPALAARRRAELERCTGVHASRTAAMRCVVGDDRSGRRSAPSGTGRRENLLQ
jgi:hypothetical protein